MLNSVDTVLEMPLLISGAMSSCFKIKLDASRHFSIAMFLTTAFVCSLRGILTTTFPEGFMYTIFMPSLGKSSIFNRCSISSSLFDTVDGMWFSVKERDFLDLPFADVELSIEGDFAASELTRTVLDFLHAGLALSGVSRVRLLLLTGVLSVDVIAGLINWYSWPKLRIFRPHGLQTRSEYCLESCTSGKPTSLQISANTTPKHSFRFDGLNKFSDEE